VGMNAQPAPLRSTPRLAVRAELEWNPQNRPDQLASVVRGNQMVPGHGVFEIDLPGEVFRRPQRDRHPATVEIPPRAAHEVRKFVLRSFVRADFHTEYLVECLTLRDSG